MKNKKPGLLFFLLLFAGRAESQLLRRPLSAGYIGLGSCSLNHIDVFSFTLNQASLAQLKNVSAGVYGERRFWLRELNSFMAVFGLPTRSGNFGLKAGYAGSSLYNETQLGLAYGKKLGSKADFGAQFNYYGIRLGGIYGSASAISAEAGAVFHLSEKLHAGCHVTNPVGGTLGNKQPGDKSTEKLSFVYFFGLGYEASEKFFIATDIEKEEHRPVTVEAGLQYRFLPQLLVRAGMSSATSAVWAGIGLIIRTLRVDITAGYHPQLGITPGLLVLFNGNPPSAKGD